jgi:3-methyladenine DNA glycosylase Tag
MPNWHMQEHHVDKPTSDHDYFERMSRVILVSGLNWRTLEKKWPGIKKAFAGFDINKVARFQEPEIGALMANPDVIRNLPKIRAIVANAAEFQVIAKEHGTFTRYLAEVRRSGGEAALRDALSKRFAFLGKGTTVIYLFSVGEDLPEATKEWEAHHDV